MQNSDILRKIPSVNDILETTEIKELISECPRSLVVNVTRRILGEIRQAALADKRSSNAGSTMADNTIPAISNRIVKSVKKSMNQTLEKAINATGVILHTSLGRAPIHELALKQIIDVSKGYSTLEVDKTTGKRSSRYNHIQTILCELTGAPAATLVNNNAAAVLLALNSITQGKEAIVSRSHLVEIGGSFRMPEVMEKSGTTLVEVGSTNRSYISDYKNAITDRTGLILIVHPSNFRITGFTHSPDLEEIANLGKEFNIPTLHDLGSGALINLKNICSGQFLNNLRGIPCGSETDTYNNNSPDDDYLSNIMSEPTVKESVAAGIDVTTFSADKLLGGPQGGLIIGRKDLIDSCKSNPLMRALRVDKTTIAALDATLRLYVDDKKALENVPILKMIFSPVTTVDERANRLKNNILNNTNGFYSATVEDGRSEIGGGSMPAETIPTKVVSVSSNHISANKLAKELRLNAIPIFARIERDMALLDPRTVIGTEEENEIVNAFKIIADKNTAN